MEKLDKTTNDSYNYKTCEWLTDVQQQYRIKYKKEDFFCPQRPEVFMEKDI